MRTFKIVGTHITMRTFKIVGKHITVSAYTYSEAYKLAIQIVSNANIVEV